MELKNKKILVVEDDTTIRKNIVEFLSLHDIVVQSAKNGLEGLSVFSAWKPDLIICDIMMPEMDGFTFLNELNRKFPFHQSIFIFLTAKNSLTDIRKGMNLGADDYLIKPFMLDDLLSTIRSKIVKHELRLKGIREAIKEVEERTSPTPYHEFNTCLNGVLMGTQILLNSEDSHFNLDERMVLDIIQQSGIRLNKAINNLIFLGDLDSGKFTPFLEDVTASSLESTLVQISKNYDRSGDLILTMVGGATHADKFLLRKILEELLDNAFKYSKIGEQVMVEIHLKEGRFIFNMEYSCGNFTEEMFQNVSAYNQFDLPVNTGVGLGLGLFLTKRLCQLLGVRLEFQKLNSQKGKYIFQFEF
ncbi:MAG: hypothetical protein CFE21_09855 [Bacteroidetes bacterium B1(2017)]|nr:MAG: hypothetical protein CFE21_09855 [Bacteroidetes bacterium B1(2017)]